MAQTAEKMEELTVPDGGIGNLIMDDDEIEAVYGDDDDGTEEYGDEGIAQFPALTKKMAAMGREGDNVIGHLESGELVIPKVFLEQNPEWKESIFQFLKDNGVEDPERYVVGSDANSLNPETGAPEFFFKFIKKVVKGVVNTVKKVVKSVVKVVKKVAPIVLPIVGTMFLGPVYGAALGSGIATLINGGSVKDALKSALVSGVTGGAMAGISGMVSGAGFGAGVQAALNPANISAGFGALKTGLTEGFGNTGVGFNSMKYGLAGGEQINAKLAEQAAAASLAQGTTTPTISAQGAEVTGAANAPALTPDQAVASAGAAPVTPITPQQAAAQATAYKPPSFTESISAAFNPNDNVSFTQGMKNAFFPGGPTAAQTTQIGNQAYTNAYTNAMQLPGMTPQLAAAQGTAAMNAATASAAPGFLRTYGPLAAVGLGTAAAAGAFTPVEAEPLDIAMRDEQGNIITGEDLVNQDPGKYLVGDLGEVVLDPETGEYVPKSVASVGAVNDLEIRAPEYSTYSAPTQYAYNPNTTYLQSSTPGGPFARPYVTQAAEGGAIFPRRNGGIMPDEGIPGQDSVRAMLMPGEFVMTTDAVRGLGNGNLNQGIQNMYSVMRNLERRGRAMA